MTETKFYYLKPNIIKLQYHRSFFRSFSWFVYMTWWSIYRLMTRGNIYIFDCVIYIVLKRISWCKSISSFFHSYKAEKLFSKSFLFVYILLFNLLSILLLIVFLKSLYFETTKLNFFFLLYFIFWFFIRRRFRFPRLHNNNKIL